MEMLPCPFCGAKAKVKIGYADYRIIGCSRPSMLCPNPSLTVYKNKKGEFDYKHWNTRNPKD